MPYLYNTVRDRALVNDTSFYLLVDSGLPFSYGPANRARPVLALAEMRMVVAILMQRFDIQFVPEYDSRGWEEELADHFVMANGGLPVVLMPRM
ncbi:uncharacterized protein FOMMEDRAFT_162567 [Fomitiporia mediterranea MF3/22]|uniref:Cytochrome P450 n=1 Tax=Fomitiporia mediterranea (strain MF3/22) TaxID=694068 RepID=R7SGC9_FOMME|nr:uncharacterized protein FOMMEDRAFT_162567 [Fomitiporia mediterranea MF3/22]EJC97756.1 hypothetical protein FOMMEDRAFT_162567 [Fomitiporia mediterranea MF3/22]